jgi:hypothetical protein
MARLGRLLGKGLVMSSKRIVTLALLLFVGVSAGYLVVTETRRGSTTASALEEQTSEAKSSSGDEARDHQVIAYYFHGTQRCKTCRTIEAYTLEALQAEFADALSEGDLVWRPVNVDEPENGHFVQDYNLTTRTVVLVGLKDGVPSNWTSLTRVWELVRDREAFHSYIQTETQRFLERDHG